MDLQTSAVNWQTIVLQSIFKLYQLVINLLPDPPLFIITVPLDEEHHLGVPSFLGVLGRLACHSWPGMVKASTLMDMVLDGMTVNCLRSELYL